MLPTRIDLGEPRHLLKLVHKLQNQGFQSKPREAFDYGRLVERFEDSIRGKCTLGRRDVRYLAWALTAGDPPLYTRESLGQALLRLSQALAISPSILRGVVHGYFGLDPARAHHHERIIGDWIIEHLLRTQSSGKVLSHWKRLPECFQKRGPVTLAQRLLSHSDLGQAFDDLKVPPHSHVGCAIARELAWKTGREIPEEIPRILSLLETRFPLEPQKKCLDILLQCAHDLRRNSPNSHLIEYSLKLLADPRIDHRGRWTGMSEKAKHIISYWVSAEDLRIFFSEISGDKRRLQFWRRYLDSGKVLYSRIVLGTDALRGCTPALRQQVANGRFARLLSSDPSLSAFILQIGQCFVVEFSLTGHACFLYPPSLFDVKTLSRHSYGLRELKRGGFRRRLIHHAGLWERDFQRALYEDFGIYPPN